MFALIYDFLLFFVRLNKTHKRTYAMCRVYPGHETPYHYNKVVEIYRSGDYSCSNSGDDKRPNIIGRDIFHCLLFKSSTNL